MSHTPRREDRDRRSVDQQLSDILIEQISALFQSLGFRVVTLRHCTPQISLLDRALTSAVRYRARGIMGAVAILGEWRHVTGFIEDYLGCFDDSMVLDAWMEISNQITGSFKNRLVEHGLALSLTPPLPANAHALHAAGASWIEVRAHEHCFYALLDVRTEDGFGLPERREEISCAMAREGELYLF